MKKTLLVASILGAVSAMSSTSAMAVEGLSANVGVTSNYFWRGMTQAADEAAVSGGIDYAAASGFYAGTWVSNVNFGSGDTETDLYLGFSGETESLSYDVGYVYFNYANAGQAADFGEVYGSVTFGALTLGLAVLANTEASEYDFGDSTYVSADYAFEVSEGLEAAFHIGSYDGDFAVEGVDIGASLSKDGFTFGLIETDRDGQGLEAYVSYAIDFDL
ncbi:TorF family putative porin [Catenovulum sp. 2E275]|uniref:TorF family putative porin n=1 Tax=Catenovulum sp. 2E275 TaxID=2980497 RepID=UPI0021D0DD67|nr:TorF family putative porin [Catenovulum sp. 2E275]MCU4675841.1 TorF family putative porin [Catenovulum sp. 2E275]